MKSLYCFSVRSQEPLFSGFVLQSFPLRPTRTPSSTVHSPPYITTQPAMSRPLKRSLACCLLPLVQQQPEPRLMRRIIARENFFMANVVSLVFYFWPARLIQFPCTKQPSNIYRRRTRYWP